MVGHSARRPVAGDPSGADTPTGASVRHRTTGEPDHRATRQPRQPTAAPKTPRRCIYGERVDIAAEMESLTPEALRERGSFKWTAGKPGQIGAFVAESDLPVAPAVRSAVAEALDRGLTGYLPGYLEREVGVACAQFQENRFGWRVDPDSVRVLPDVLGALAFTADHLVKPGTPIVLPTPAYMPFLVKPGLIRRELRTVTMRRNNGRYLIDPTELAAALEGGGLLILVNPHNPTGQVATSAELLAIATVVEQTGSTVFADEIHSPVVFPGASHLPYAALSPQTAAHTVTGVSASKGWNLPGLTCAQLILTSPVHRSVGTKRISPPKWVRRHWVRWRRAPRTPREWTTSMRWCGIWMTPAGCSPIPWSPPCPMCRTRSRRPPTSTGSTCVHWASRRLRWLTGSAFSAPTVRLAVHQVSCG